MGEGVRLSREELHERVWSEPLRTLAERWGVSHPTLKKACERAEVPTPDRGHWAKKEAGKPVRRPALPRRLPGMDREVRIGGNPYWYYDWTREELLAPLPSAPEFEEPIEAVRERVGKALGEVAMPRQVRLWHPSLARLLAEDEKRRAKQAALPYKSPWDDPLFDTPFERRRLRLLNALFLAVPRMKGRGDVRSKDGRDPSVSFHGQHVGLVLEALKAKPARGGWVGARPEPEDGRMRLSIPLAYGSDKVRREWADEADRKLEACLTEVAVEVVVTAELTYREQVLRQHQHRAERKAALEEAERKARAEAERQERERQERLAQARIDRLLGDAALFRQASDIRAFVAAMVERSEGQGAAEREAFERWRAWALAQADRIDPSLGAAFMRSMEGGAEV